MFGIGMPEMLLILAVALIVIGPKKLPDLAKSLGKALGEFKKATSELKESIQIDPELKDVKTAFNDINRDFKDNRPARPDRTDENPAASAGSDQTPDDDASQDDDPMDQLKTAFNRRETEGPKPDGAVPDTDGAPISGSEPDSDTRKG